MCGRAGFGFLQGVGLALTVSKRCFGQRTQEAACERTGRLIGYVLKPPPERKDGHELATAHSYLKFVSGERFALLLRFHHKSERDGVFVAAAGASALPDLVCEVAPLSRRRHADQVMPNRCFGRAGRKSR